MENTQHVLLAVLAHPDDESFGMGGTLALYAQRGIQVHLICATRGEAGDMDADCLEGFDSIAERRVSELRCAAAILGLTGVYFLDYRDSGMPGSADNGNPDALMRAPLAEVSGKIAHYIRKLHPQVIITFDPIGGYKHPDHIAVHQATVQAFNLAADASFLDEDLLLPWQGQKLYYHVFPKGALHLAAWVMPILGRDPRHFGRNGDIDLVELVNSGNFPAHATIDYRIVDEKREAAAACHASQLGGGPPDRGILSWLWRRTAGKDHFMRAYPPFKGKLKETDLFEGIQ